MAGFWGIEFINFTYNITCKETYHAPVVIHLLQRDRVEDDAGHHLGEDGAILDKPVVVGGWFLMNNGHNPLQNLVLQLQVFLQRK